MTTKCHVLKLLNVKRTDDFCKLETLETLTTHIEFILTTNNFYSAATFSSVSAISFCVTLIDFTLCCSTGTATSYRESDKAAETFVIVGSSPNNVCCRRKILHVVR